MGKIAKKKNCKSHPNHDAYEFNEDGLYRYRGTSEWYPGGSNSKGYRFCSIRSMDTTKQTTIPVHMAMWQTFKGEIPAKHEIDHIDRNPSNNKLENLQCLTVSENRKRRDHSFLAGVRGAKKNPVQKVKATNLISDEVLVFSNKSRCGKYYGCSPALIYHVCTGDNYARTYGGYVTFEYTNDDVTQEVPRKKHDRPKGAYKYKTEEDRIAARKEHAKKYREKKALKLNHSNIKE